MQRAGFLPAVGLPKPIAHCDGNSITRLAIFGGAYGNVPAFEACLRHAERTGCDGFAFIGDVTGFCGHSDEIIDLVRTHCPILTAGNYEQKAAAGETDCGCNYECEEDNAYGSRAHQWAMRSLSGENRAWLGAWPDLTLLETVCGPILLCHGSPSQTNEFLFESQLNETRLEQWLDEFGAKGLVCSHSGFPWTRKLPGERFAANCGVCGKPDHDGDPAVHYAAIELRAGSPPIAHLERVEYDHAAWADQLAGEGVDAVYTDTLRDGIWRCGLLSLPEAESQKACVHSPFFDGSQSTPSYE